MAQLTIRKLDDVARQRLEARAARNGRSLEAEVRAILEETANGEAAPLLRNDEKGFGDLMYERFKDSGLTEDEVSRFNLGIAEINSRWHMSIPDFEADGFEEANSDK
jgi:antitoxin FitA